MPPAPGLVSSTIGWPTNCWTLSRTTRAVVSEALPGGKGLMTLIGRVGHSSAFADAAAIRSTAPSAAANGRSDNTKSSQFKNRTFSNLAAIPLRLPFAAVPKRGGKAGDSSFPLAGNRAANPPQMRWAELLSPGRMTFEAQLNSAQSLTRAIRELLVPCGFSSLELQIGL